MAVALAGASPVATAAPFLEEAFLKPSDPAAFGAFGTDVAVQGQRLVVGNWDAAGGPYSRAYCFTRTGSQWTERQILDFPGAGQATQVDFGYRVALLDDWLAVGAIRETNPDVPSTSGFVYLYRPTGANGAWEVATRVGSTLAMQGGRFGEALAMSPNRMAIGQLGVRGSAHLYSLVGSQWVAESVILGPEVAGFPFSFEFGRSIALSRDGQWLVVGSPRESSQATGVNGNPNDVSSPGSGAAYVYRRSAAGQGQGPGWELQAYLKASNTDSNDLFGMSVAIDADGSTVVVGAPFEDSAAEGVNGSQENADPVQPLELNRGAAYVFRRPPGGTLWTQAAYLKPFGISQIAATAADQFGNDVVIQGHLIIVGAHNSTRSAAYVFERATDGSWAARERLTPSHPGNVRFTQSLAIDADTAVFSAHQDSTIAERSGAVYVFTGFAATPASPLPAVTYQADPPSVSLVLLGTAGNPYQLQRSPDLLVWIPLETVVASADGSVRYTDSSPLPTGGYYRLKSP